MSSDVPPETLRCFASTYPIEHELGQGGMAVVYLSRDLRHGRQVALKVLRYDIGATPAGAERFLREIRIAAGLQHPHILPLYDSGQAGGQLFYVMPYVEGESLRQRLAREGPLPVDEAVRIAREVAEALAYAHERGIVHRDIKPDNILLASGHALVADFGIARAADAAGLKLTETGMAIGTPAYMSPEQAMGDPHVDGRADQYALGCVLYEMLAGQPPFVAPSSQAVMARHTADPVPPLSTLRPAVPPAIESAVLTSLEKLPADRFASATEFAAALATPAPAGTRPRLARFRMRHVAAASTIVLLAAGIALTQRLRANPSVASIAALPCEVRGGAGDPDMTREATTGDLIGALAELGRFERVISWQSSKRYADTRKSPQEVGAELGVTTLLYCRLQQTPSSERLSVELINARDGSLIWQGDAESGAGTLSSVSLGASLAQKAADRLRLPRAAGEMVARGPGTSDLQALNLYREGLYHVNRLDEPSVRRGIVLLQQALERDRNFGQAYAALAFAYTIRGIGHGSLDHREAFPLVKEAAEAALRLNDRLAEAHAALAEYELFYGYNWSAAERGFRRAIALDSNYANAHGWFGILLYHLGRFPESSREMDRARLLDPANPLWWTDAANVRYLMGNYAEADSILRLALQMDSTFSPAHLIAGLVAVERADYRAAEAHFMRAWAFRESGAIRAFVALARGAGGDRAGALALIDSLAAGMDTVGSKFTAALAVAYVGVGDYQRALDFFERAYQTRSSVLPYFLIGPVGRRLVREPRYQALMRRIGLPLPSSA